MDLNTIVNNKVKKQDATNIIWGCCPRYSRENCFAWNKFQIFIIYMSQKQESFRRYHNLSCKSKYLIYCMGCTLCQIQYIDKAKTPFNIWSSNNRWDIPQLNAKPWCCCFAQNNVVLTLTASFSFPKQWIIEINK